MTTAHTDILTEVEFNELRDFLAQQQQKRRGFNIVEAHGYMAGLICGPEVVHPSIWLQIIFNGDVEYTSYEQEERIINYLCRMYNNTAKHVHSGEMFPELYYPIHPANTESAVDFQAIREWLRAFVDAVVDDDWMKISDFQIIAFPIIISSQGDEDETLQEICLDRKSTIEEVRSHFFQFITPALFQLYHYFAQIKHHAEFLMLEEEGDDAAPVHDCHGCGTVH